MVMEIGTSSRSSMLIARMCGSTSTTAKATSAASIAKVGPSPCGLSIRQGRARVRMRSCIRAANSVGSSPRNTRRVTAR